MQKCILLQTKCFFWLWKVNHPLRRLLLTESNFSTPFSNAVLHFKQSCIDSLIAVRGTGELQRSLLRMMLFWKLWMNDLMLSSRHPKDNCPVTVTRCIYLANDCQDFSISDEVVRPFTDSFTSLVSESIQLSRNPPKKGLKTDSSERRKWRLCCALATRGLFHFN